MIVIAYVDVQLTMKQLMQNWIIVSFGNFVGAAGIMGLIYFNGHWDVGKGVVGAKVIAITNPKINLTWMEVFTRGIVCNILVCLAVWWCFSGRTVVDKVLVILLPIAGFVTIGFEHSVADMYFIPAGLMANQHNECRKPDNNELSFNNLLPVTLGNIVGSSVFVGLFYWFIYLRN